MNVSGSRIAWEGPWRFRVETAEFPDGTTLELGKVEHPGSVVLIPLQAEGSRSVVLMLRQFRHALNETILELPAGTRGWDEAWLPCAQRELREETGFRAETFVPLGEIWPAPGISDERMALYLAMDLSPDPLPVDADELIEVHPMPLVELVAMAQDGRLQDGKSVIGILRAAAHLAASEPVD